MNDERLRQLYFRGLDARGGGSGGGVECAVAPDDLLALARGELPEERRLELLDQVMVNERCRREFDLIRAVVAAERAALAAEGRGEAASDVGAGGRQDAAPSRPTLLVVAGGAPRSAPAVSARPWWRGAALPTAIAAALVLGVGLGQSFRNRPADVEVTRGAEDAGALAPTATVVEGGAPRLAWRSLPGATRYAVEVVDAEGTAVYEAATTDTTLTLPGSVTLRADREYSWIVRATDDAGAERGSAVRRLTVRPAAR